MRNKADVARAAHLRKKYGITLQQYDEILERQNHCCAICKRHKSEFKINLAVDHDHVSGEIRGAACTYCNRRLIGRHRNPALLRTIADYLENGTGLFVPKQRRPVKRRPNKG